MENPNRIDSLSVSQTTGRQTPKQDFGDMLLKAGGEAVRVGGILASGVTSGSPVLSAAVAGVSSVVAQGMVTSLPAAAPAPSTNVQIPEGKGEAFDLLRLQDQQSKQYLTLQMQMQQESREYNTISNVMKVRHDSAKAAINNVR